MGKQHSSVSDFGYRASLFDNDHDIADVIEVCITTPASGSYWLATDVISDKTVNISLKEDVTIATAGEAMVFYGRSRQGDYPDDCECLIERDDADSSYTGGTTILTKVELRAEGGNHTLMKQGATYLLSVTSKTDANWTSVVVWVWQGDGGEGGH